MEILSADETVCNESQKSSTNSRTPIANLSSQHRSERVHLASTPHNGAAHRNSIGMLMFLFISVCVLFLCVS